MSVLSDPENAPYEPGYRFYFDAYRIIKDELDMRTIGVILAKGRMPLDPYLVEALSVADIDPVERMETWTPQLFTKAANDQFMAIIEKAK